MSCMSHSQGAFHFFKFTIKSNYENTNTFINIPTYNRVYTKYRHVLFTAIDIHCIAEIFAISFMLSYY